MEQGNTTTTSSNEVESPNYKGGVGGKLNGRDWGGKRGDPAV